MFEDVIDSKVELADRALDDDLRRLELDRRNHDAELIAAILVAETRGLYGRDGHRSMNGYLRATFNWSTSEAGRWRAHARAVGNITGLGDALAGGRIGAAQITVFAKAHTNTRVRDALDQLAPTLIRHAEELPLHDFETVMTRVVELADTDGAEQREHEAIENRSATAVDVDGSLYMKASGGDAIATARLVAILDRFVELEFAKDTEARRAEHGDNAPGIPLARTDTQRRRDALDSIFSKANDALDDELPDGVTPTPLVNIIVDDTTFSHALAAHGLAAITDLDGTAVDPFTGAVDPVDLLAELLEDPSELLNRRCETSNGVALSPHHVVRAALAGHVRRVVINAAGVVIDLGRRTRLFTGPARDAARMMIRNCEHPGCTLRAEFCDTDHTIEWTDDGTTDQANSGIRCTPHNRDKHRRRWRVRRDSAGRAFTIRDDGTIILPVGRRQPEFPDDADDPAEIARLTGLARTRTAALTNA